MSESYYREISAKVLISLVFVASQQDFQDN